MSDIDRSHYVCGFIFDYHGQYVLLQKRTAEEPECMQYKWNGVGGRIDSVDEKPIEAMIRETEEEIGLTTYTQHWQHKATVVCPGGTIFFFAYFREKNEDILFVDTTCKVFPVLNLLGIKNMMKNLEYLIPLCRMKLEQPAFIYQSTI